MKPRTEKMTNPAKILVQHPIKGTNIASLYKKYKTNFNIYSILVFASTTNKRNGVYNKSL